MADRNGSLDGLYGLDISVSVHTCPDEIRVALAGELDLATAERLDRALQDVLERRPARLVVDLSSLEFMDASGIGALVGADRCAARAGGRLEVFAGAGQPRRLLELCGLMDHLSRPRHTLRTRHA